jgi:RNA polymerase sigma-70 factor (ECF subfamily)
MDPVMMHDPMEPRLAAPPAVRLAVEDATVRRRVWSALRVRVGAAAAEDVSQAVYCEALCSATAPDDPAEIPLWILGIARHRAVDFFRRAPREVPSEDVHSRAPAPASPIEAHDLAHRVASRCDEEQKKTLGWMLLEQEGVPLQDIAREQGLSPSAVRGRVYRLRRLLRREFGAMLAALLVAVGVGAGARALRSAEAPRVEAGAAGLPAWATGPFEIVDVTLPDGTDDAVRVLVSGEAKGARVSMRPGRLEVWTPTGSFVRKLAPAPVIRERDGDREDLVLDIGDAQDNPQRVTLTRDALGRIIARSSEGKLRGTLVLRAVRSDRP